MQTQIKDFLIMSVLLMSLDFTYIYMMMGVFQKQIVDVQRVVMKFRPAGAVVCYLLILAGLYWFIIRRRRSPLEAAFLGAFVYGVYDSTNYAMLKKWDAKVALIDTLWGAILFFITTAGVYAARGLPY